MSQPRILFVDDEPEVLEGLKVRLRQRRKDWAMEFAHGGNEALALCEKAPFDVVVSDLRMPEVDGAMLLERLRETYPATSRVMLSGHGDARQVLRAMANAHEFLPKPSPPGVLEGTLERICALQALIHDPKVREAIGRVAVLPAQPRVFGRLMAALGEERSSPEAVSAILMEDPALSAQILHIVNSAYFRLSRPIVKVEEAVVYLGLSTVRQLVLVAEVYRDVGQRAPSMSQQVDELQEHALLTAKIAATILKGYKRRDLAFGASLLHDIGKLVIVSQLPERMEKIQERAKASGLSVNAAERELFGTTHAEIGAYLLSLWQVPLQLVEAVANHHLPRRTNPVEVDAVVAVHVADFLAHEHQVLKAGGAVDLHAELDLELLKTLGADTMLSEWRAIAQ